MSKLIEIEKSTLNIGSVYKIIIVLVACGGAWLRFEHKMDEQSEKVLKKIDEHILSDKYEKQILEGKIALLTQRLERAEEYGESILSKEFVRPTDTRLENKKKSIINEYIKAHNLQRGYG